MNTKYLSHYLEAKQSELFNELGIFFAFNEEQLKEGQEQHRDKLKGKNWVSLGAGMIMPIVNLEEFNKRHKLVIQAARAEDIKENGLNAIYAREIWNYEEFISWEPGQAWEECKKYPGANKKDFDKVYKYEFQKALKEDRI